MANFRKRSIIDMNDYNSTNLSNRYFISPINPLYIDNKEHYKCTTRIVNLKEAIRRIKPYKIYRIRDIFIMHHHLNLKQEVVV